MTSITSIIALSIAAILVVGPYVLAQYIKSNRMLLIYGAISGLVWLILFYINAVIHYRFTGIFQMQIVGIIMLGLLSAIFGAVVKKIVSLLKYSTKAKMIIIIMCPFVLALVLFILL